MKKIILLSSFAALIFMNKNIHAKEPIACRELIIALCKIHNNKKDWCKKTSQKDLKFGKIDLKNFNKSLKEIAVAEKNLFFKSCSLKVLDEDKDGSGVYLGCTSNNNIINKVYNFSYEDDFALVQENELNKSKYTSEILCKNNLPTDDK